LGAAAGVFLPTVSHSFLAPCATLGADSITSPQGTIFNTESHPIAMPPPLQKCQIQAAAIFAHTLFSTRLGLVLI
jgi:hypothetical protein